MAQQGTRGVLLPFASGRREAGRPHLRRIRRTRASRRAAAARPAAPATPDIARDAERNAQWDQLLELTVQACTWRDPESLAAVEAVLALLKQETLREWSG